MANVSNLFARRRARVRRQISQVAGGRPRLSVFRSHKQIYAQIIDTENGNILAQASTIDKELRKNVSKMNKSDAASAVGKMVADRAVKAGIDKVVFDRGGYLYHGRVKALAEAAREGGLKF